MSHGYPVVECGTCVTPMNNNTISIILLMAFIIIEENDHYSHNVGSVKSPLLSFYHSMILLVLFGAGMTMTQPMVCSCVIKRWVAPV